MPAVAEVFLICHIRIKISEFLNVLETQDPETVFHLINEMRLQSGFSQLADISLVSDALNDLKAYYLQTIKPKS